MNDGAERATETQREPGRGRVVATADLPPPVPPPVSNGVAVAALIVGIVALPLFFTFVVALLAVLLGGIGLAKARQPGGTGRRPALAGLILGVVSLLAGVVFVGGQWWWGDTAPVDLDAAVTDTADPDDYAVEVGRCDRQPDGVVTATGSIRNESSQRRNYRLRVEFVRDDVVLERGDDLLFSVEPSESDTWLVQGFVEPETEVRCAVVAVENYLS